MEKYLLLNVCEMSVDIHWIRFIKMDLLFYDIKINKFDLFFYNKINY